VLENYKERIRKQIQKSENIKAKQNRCSEPTKENHSPRENTTQNHAVASWLIPQQINGI